MPVLLGLYLLNLTNRPAGGGSARPAPARLRPRSRAAGRAGIGIPGLGLYLGARELGWNTQVQASGLADNWWTVPVLILSAAQNAVLEEVIMIGYLFTRFAPARAGGSR